MRLILSAGHAEYVLPSLPGLDVRCIWGTDESEKFDQLDRNPDAMDWQVATGESVITMPVADLMWESIYSIEGDPALIKAALAMLLWDLTDSPGADDGTYDYWPSGMRFADEIDRALGSPYRAIWEQVARRIILEIDSLGYDRSDSAYELFDKIGWIEEAEKHKP